MEFRIESAKQTELESVLKHKIDTKTKPLGALGQLEDIAFQIGRIQNTDAPEISKPTIVVFAGDHGIAKKGEVNPFPQEVTTQMVYNFLNGGAAINVFSKTNGVDLKIVDAGVNHKFETHPNLIDCKIGFGTKNYQEEPAMSIQECELAMQKGADIVEQLYQSGCNCVGFGEMGIGNTSAASLLMNYFLRIPIADCVGAGTGLQAEGIQKKSDILQEVCNKYNPKSPLEALATFGGFEIAMMTGAMLKAASLKMILVIDGFIVNSALLAAQAINKTVLDYCLFSHVSNEQGHQTLLSFLNAKPILNLGLRLGEGTGAALAIPLIKSAVNFLNDMASFESAEVSNAT